MLDPDLCNLKDDELKVSADDDLTSDDLDIIHILFFCIFCMEWSGRLHRAILS